MQLAGNEAHDKMADIPGNVVIASTLKEVNEALSGKNLLLSIPVLQNYILHILFLN